MRRLLDGYNQRGNVIFISSYPEKKSKYSQKVCALGGFTKNTLLALKPHLKKEKSRIIVLTTILKNKQEIYEENEMLIIRIFKRNSLKSYLSLFLMLIRFSQIKSVVIEFEFASFGDTLITSLFLSVLLFLKILGKKTILVLHQVVENLKELTGHLGWNKTDWKNKLLNILLKQFYKVSTSFCENVVVLEEEFKKRLIKMGVSNKKIKVIPHGVDSDFEIMPRNIARKKLNLPDNKFIVLYFGYLTWYKGADIFLKIAQENKSLLFVIAGGPSFTQKHKPHYQKYLQQFNHLPENVLLTGFVPENKIALYYCASDLVLLPYRSMISSSGPLSLAFSFEKPILLSDKLRPYIKTKDFQQAMKTAHLEKEELFFPLTYHSLKNISSPTYKKLAKFSRLMKKQRDYQRLAFFYLQLINNLLKSTISNYDYRLAISYR